MTNTENNQKLMNCSISNVSESAYTQHQGTYNDSCDITTANKLESAMQSYSKTQKTSNREMNKRIETLFG